MNKLLLSVSLFVISFASHAQQVQWLRSADAAYAFNPQLPVHSVSASGNNIFWSRLDSAVVNYGTEVFGVQAIDCYDSLGNGKWSFVLSDSVLLNVVASDAGGNVYAGGRYMGTMHLNGTDSLANTGSGFDTNIFLISLDSMGNLRWKRNVTLSFPAYVNLTALAVDANGFCWYAIQEFMISKLVRVDSQGADIQTLDVNGTRQTSGLAFDRDNNMYFSGAAENGTISFDTLSAPVPESYMMFLARLNASGRASWVRLAHDVTFSSPRVTATIHGDAFLGGYLLDSTSWGSINFSGPQWVYDFFLTRVDSSGNFQWGVEVPATPAITGDFEPGAKEFIGTDDNGNLYITGTVRGTVDWGNNVISGSSQISAYQTSIVSFDYNGTPRWSITGGSPGFDAAFSVSVTSVDHLYFACAGQDSISFDSLITNGGGGYASCFGKIVPSITTGIPALSGKDQLIVYPNPSAGNALHLINPLDRPVVFSLFNNLSQQIFSLTIPGKSAVEKYVENGAGGIYFYRAETGSGLAGSGRIILNK